MHLGRVTGNRVLETRFRTDWSEKVMVGEMLVVEDSSSEDMYLVRVMDVEHGAEMNRDDWITVQAGEVMHGEVPLSTIQGRIFCTGVCSPLGQLSGGGFRKTKTIPSHFSTDPSRSPFLLGSDCQQADRLKEVKLRWLKGQLLQRTVRFCRGGSDGHSSTFSPARAGPR